jgi:hypothetical protein
MTLHIARIEKVRTLSLRHRTHAVIFREMSGIFRSPKESRRLIAAEGGMIDAVQQRMCEQKEARSRYESYANGGFRLAPHRSSCRRLVGLNRPIKLINLSAVVDVCIETCPSALLVGESFLRL